MNLLVSGRSPAFSTTLDSFIEQGKEMPLTYSKLCLTEVDNRGTIRIVYNLLDDYVEELESYLIEVTLTDEEVIKYKYKPKVLAFDAYGRTDYYSFILYFNKLSSVKEFTLESKKIKMMKAGDLSKVLSSILSSEMKTIKAYTEAVEQEEKNKAVP